MRELPSYLPSLDGLRAFAVIAVILYHLVPAILPSGLLGVTLFFVLSGYLITGLLIKEWNKTSTIHLGRFWLRRIRRLVPAIIFLFVGVAALTALFAPDLLTKLREDMVPALLFFTNWWYIFRDVSYFEAMGAPSPVTHFWSLAIEEQFYLIWPPILLLLFTIGLRKRGIQTGIALASGASVALMALLYDPLGDPSRVYYGTDTRAFSLLIGAWLAFQFPMERVMGQGERPFGDRGRTVSAWLAWAACVGIIAVMVTISGYDPFLYQGGILLISLLCAVLIVGLVNLTSTICRVFSLKPLVWVGQRSYGIYLWHYPLILLMNPMNSTTEPPWWVYLIQMAIVLAVAEFSYRLIEMPVRRGDLGRWVRGVRDGSVSVLDYLAGHLLQFTGSLVLISVAIVGCIVVPPTQTIGNTSVFEGEGALPMPREPLMDKPAEATGELVASSEPEPAPEPAGPTPEELAEQANVLIIGDSVLAGVQGYGYFDGVLPNATVDAKISRQLYTAKDFYQQHVDEGWDGEVVIFEMGTNGVATAEQVEEMVNAVPADKKVLLVNIRTPFPLEGMNNALLQDAANNHDNVTLVDWFDASEGHDEYFDGDGTHLTPTGCEAYIAMLRSALADLYR